MLNEGRVLKYVKERLGFPYTMIELDDEGIMEVIRSYTLKEFSHFFPHVNTIGFNPKFPSNKVPGKANEFYIIDPDNLEILNIVDIYFPMGDYIMHGHPPLGPLSLGELATFALNVEIAGWIKQFSSFDHTFEFRHPNIVRITGMSNADWMAIEYEREQPPDFSGIPNDIQNWFLDLALADIMIIIGRIRKKYSEGGGIKTPFGDIPLQADILDEGKELRREVIEKLTTGSLPNITLDIG